MTGAASVSLSQDILHRNWQSRVGQGGFDVTVDEHTQPNGAVISATATVDQTVPAPERGASATSGAMCTQQQRIKAWA